MKMEEKEGQGFDRMLNLPHTWGRLCLPDKFYLCYLSSRIASYQSGEMGFYKPLFLDEEVGAQLDKENRPRRYLDQSFQI